MASANDIDVGPSRETTTNEGEGALRKLLQALDGLESALSHAEYGDAFGLTDSAKACALAAAMHWPCPDCASTDEVMRRRAGNARPQDEF